MIKQKGYPCLLAKHQGFSLPGAIFILVLLSSIGVAMVTLNSTSTTTSALNVQQTRAFYSAISGSEWAIATIVENDDDHDSNNGSCDGVHGVSFAMDQFSLTFSCSSTCIDALSCCHSIVDCQLSPRVSEVSVTATSGTVGETYRVKRTIQATVSYDGS